MPRMMPSLLLFISTIVTTCMLIGGCIASSNADIQADIRASNQKLLAIDLFNATWEQYKRKFIERDGRLIDSYHDISHSEGQGTAMLFAVIANDKKMFESTWIWTQQELQRKDNLFAWRWETSSTPHVTDFNNASDGDVLIAWALLKAHEKWGNESYLTEARLILEAIRELLVVDFAGYKVLLPGGLYYYQGDYLTYNFSYNILPAFSDFARYGNAEVWHALYADSLRLINLTSSSGFAIPPDWLNIDFAGQLAIAEKHGAKSGYDAIRVPLYLAWCGHSKELEIFRTFWQKNGNWKTAPSWVDLLTKEQATYHPNPGVVSVRALAFPDGNDVLFSSYPVEDYYSVSLKMFSLMSVMSSSCSS